MRSHAPAGVRVALEVAAEGERSDSQDPCQVNWAERTHRFLPACRDFEALDVRRDFAAARDEEKTAVRDPPDDRILGGCAWHGPRLSPVDRIEDEGAAARLDEDQSAVGRHEDRARAFRRDGAGLAFRDVLHVAADAFAFLVATKDDPLAVRKELRRFVAE